MFEVVSASQEFLNNWLTLDADALLGAGDRFALRIAAPARRCDPPVLRDALISLALKAGKQLHEIAHWRDAQGCRFQPAASLGWIGWDDARAPVIERFATWASSYVNALTQSHAVFAAARAARSISQRFSEPLVISDVCLEAGCPEGKLRREFQAHYGVSMREFHTRVRILNSFTLLRDGIKSEAVAHLVGFRRANKFYEHFKELTGTTPYALKARLGCTTIEEFEKLVQRPPVRRMPLDLLSPFWNPHPAPGLPLSSSQPPKNGTRFLLKQNPDCSTITAKC